MTHCAVLGSPIGHSLSPVLHRAAYAELGLDWSYDAIEVTEDRLGDFLDGLDDGWRGLSLTMPLKRAVLPLLDSVDDWTRLSGVANTVVLAGGRRHGMNTDVTGAMAAIRDGTDRPLSSAVVLGGGATATSVILALVELGVQAVTVVVRDPARATPTVEAVARHRHAPDVSVTTFGAPLPAADIVVSTVPAAAQSADLVDQCDRIPVVFDVVYHPWPTPLAAAAGSRVLIRGLDLLVAQAHRQVEAMTDRRLPPGLLAVMRAAGEQALREGA
jgi:shikimate dehydrogenase